MHRHFRNVFLALVALGLVFAGPVTAGEEDALREKVRELEQKVEALSGQQSNQLSDSIDDYLESSSAWQAAQADDDGGMSKVRITAALTANSQNEINQDSTQAIVSGDIDLGFHMDVTENLQLHITGAAATSGQSNVSGGFAGGADQTLSGKDDNVGTNGNQSTVGTGRTFYLYEAFIVHGIKAGSSKVYWEIGMMDPRNRFLQNAFADNENTQFMNNLFDDPSSWNWGTDGLTFPGIMGLHAWYSFGKEGMHTINLGWFNTAGSFWDKGVLGIQYTLKLKVAGRDMNARIAIQYDNALKDNAGDARLAWGISWDWWATDKIGVFVRIAGSDDGATGAAPAPVVSVDFDWSLGAEFHLIASRKDDYFGVALGSNGNTSNVANADADELVFEIYYLLAIEEGKAQITPYIMYVGNPGGFDGPNVDDLIIFGVRIHVPF
jgi:hypothetical protein